MLEVRQLLTEAAEEFRGHAETLEKSHTNTAGDWDCPEAFRDWQQQRRLFTRCTAAAEAIEAERNESYTEPVTLAAWMDHLTHDVDSPEAWADENRYGIVRTPDGLMSLSVLTADPCLADPHNKAWTRAIVWHLIDRYEDEAKVYFPVSTAMDEAESAAASIERELATA